MLIDDGVIETGASWGPWRIHAERLDPERVPATLTGVLQTRIDSLALAEREALQGSSVVGRVFWDGTVASIGHRDIEVTASCLEAACQRELVFRREYSSFDECVEFVFKHALLRDVTYETVLLRDRQRLHRLVADWISDHAGERQTEYAGLIATHHRMGGDLASAADWLYRAAAVSLGAGNSAAARRSLDEAFELWQQDEVAPPVDALTTMTEACLRLGDLDAASGYDDEALRRAESPQARSMALFLGSWIASERGEFDREQAMLDEVLPEVERQGGRLLGRVLAGLSWNAMARGDADAAKAYAAQARELARHDQNPAATRVVLALLTMIAGMDGDVRAAVRYSTEALAIAVEVGDLEGEALAHSNLGVGHHLLGDAEETRDEYLAALDHYRQARSLSRRLGSQIRDGTSAANMAQVHVRLGEDPEARRLTHEALTVVRKTGATWALMFCVLAEADRRLTNGDTATALELIGLVQGQPALNSDGEAELGRILGRSGLPADVIEEGMARGVDQDFDAVVDRLTQELTRLEDFPA